MPVVQRIEGGDRDLGFAEVACRGFLLPEPIAGAEVKEVVTADSGIRNGARPNGASTEKASAKG